VGLRDIAAADLKTIVEDTNDFGWPIKITAPNGSSADLVGLSTDISQTIDPETGQAVSGRTASVTLVIATLETQGIGLPHAVSDPKARPWVIRFDDINGHPHTFRVLEAMPDRAAGCVVCLLDAYKPNAPDIVWPLGS
jgi:hypothetical protein